MSRVLICAFALFSSVLLATSAASADPSTVVPTIDVSKPNLMPAYPAIARVRGEKGTAVVFVQVSETGAVIEVKLGKSSGYQDLDNSALAAVRDWHFHPAITDGKPAAKWTAVGVSFTLAGVRNVPEDIDAELIGQHVAAAGYDPQEVICREDVGATGTHLPGPRVCHTRKEWETMSERAQRSVHKALDNPGTQIGGP